MSVFIVGKSVKRNLYDFCPALVTVSVWLKESPSRHIYIKTDGILWLFSKTGLVKLELGVGFFKKILFQRCRSYRKFGGVSSSRFTNFSRNISRNVELIIYTNVHFIVNFAVGNVEGFPFTLAFWTQIGRFRPILYPLTGGFFFYTIYPGFVFFSFFLSFSS